MGSYGLALWAMTQAPLAVVAALRETSIFFGALIAFIVLERATDAAAHLGRLRDCRRGDPPAPCVACNGNISCRSCLHNLPGIPSTIGTLQLFCHLIW